MLMLSWAVVVASLLGSLHCVGMCGPLAMWASGASERESTYRVAQATILYHLGRLSLYALIGGLAGALGSLLELGGTFLGWQLLAARVVGVLMVLVGIWQLHRYLTLHGFLRRFGKQTSKGLNKGLNKPSSVQPNFVTQWIVKLRPSVFSLSLELRGLVVGLLTAFLPCGWLYLFALVAAGTASMTQGMLVMAAFWLGTLPALTAVVVGAQRLSSRFRTALPVLAAMLLIAAGCFAFTGRGFAGMESLPFLEQPLPHLSLDPDELDSADPTWQGQFLEAIEETELPCCADKRKDR